MNLCTRFRVEILLGSFTSRVLFSTYVVVGAFGKSFFDIFPNWIILRQKPTSDPEKIGNMLTCKEERIFGKIDSVFLCNLKSYFQYRDLKFSNNTNIRKFINVMQFLNYLSTFKIFKGSFYNNMLVRFSFFFLKEGV